MDSKENAKEEPRKAESGLPFGNFENMSEMMRNCCSMMAKMMGPTMCGEKTTEQAAQTGSKEGTASKAGG